MTLEEYMRELILMSRQYGQEEELYPLINMLLRENAKVGDLSVRDVHNKGSRGVRKKIFRGYASYPDLAIVSENLNLELAEDSLDLSELKKLYGCVEAKIFNSNYNNKEKDAENSNYIFSILDYINAEWELDYPYILEFKTNGGSWSNGYYTNLTMEEIPYSVELDINEEIKKKEFFSVATEKKAKLNFGKYEKYKICERTVRINKRTHRDIIQLLSELFLYGKIIYTDGLVWYYLELKKPSKKNICKNLNGLSDLLNNDDINDKRKNGFIDAIENIREIQVLSVEIGNLKEIFLEIQEDTKKDNKTSLSCITEYLQKIESKKSEVKPNQEWNRLKDNLASINWSESNTKKQFQ